MRNEKEKKTVQKSIKITPEQEAVIAKRMADTGCSFNALVIQSLFHGDNSLTPEILANIQEIVNCAMRAVDTGMDMRDELEGGMKKLWSYLK